MAITYIDTNKIEEIGNDIIALATEYQVEINKLFKRLNEVPTVTREWVGQSANKYFNLIALDKNDFLTVGNQLRNFGKQVTNVAESFNRQIKTNADEERKKGA